MTETRFQPRVVSRSTGIDQTTGQAGRPNAAAGSNATSHVSAAPGVSNRAHAHVVNARNPSGVANHRGPAPTISPRSKSQDATVQIIQKPGSQADRGAPALAAASSVQLLGPRPQAARHAMTLDEMMLIGGLLDKYVVSLNTIGDTETATTAQSALDKLTEMIHLAMGTDTTSGPVRTAPPIQAGAPVPIAAQTSTTIVSTPPAKARVVDAGVLVHDQGEEHVVDVVSQGDDHGAA